MTGFRILLAAIFGVLLTYTVVVIAHHGWGLLPVYFSDMGKMAWPGQFNLDFMFMLTLSGLWVSWRHRFSVPGLGLGLLAFFGGALFLSVYLMVLTLQTQGDMRRVLLGHRA